VLPAAGSGSSNLEPFVQLAATLPGKSVRDVARKVVQLHVSGGAKRVPHPPPRARARVRARAPDAYLLTRPPPLVSPSLRTRAPARQQAEAKAAAAAATVAAATAAAAARGGGEGGAAALKRGGGAAAVASSSSSGSFKHKARIASLLKANLEHVAAMRKNLLALKLDDNLALVAKFRDSVDETLQCLEGVGVRMPPLPVQVNTGLLAAKEAGDALAAAAAAAASAAATGAGAAAEGGDGGAGAAPSAGATAAAAAAGNQS
jgi:hypothetical protein